MASVITANAGHPPVNANRRTEGGMVVIVVALLLLPAQGALLYAMDRLEDRVLNERGEPARSARHARSRHLRLVKGTGSANGGSGRDERHADAA